jgi:hypothetical protein
MSSVRYSDDENARLVQLWMSGATEAEMIETLKRNKGAIRRKAEQLGLPPLRLIRTRIAAGLPPEGK